MSGLDDWAKQYARQADADFKSWSLLQTDGSVPECHKLLFLQMACEKLCKAHLVRAGSSPADIQKSHAYIAKNLPLVVRNEALARSKKLKGMKQLLKAVRQVAQEIEVLNPAVDRNGQRPDNCEYPWEIATGDILSPLDWTFHPGALLLAPNGRTILKLIRGAIDALL